MSTKEQIYKILSDKWNIFEQIEIEDEVADHLLEVLNKAVEVSTDEEGGLIIGVPENEEFDFIQDIVEDE
jgi:hypothetical protein